MPADRPIVIVGASAAGHACAAGLRERGYDGPIELVGREPESPYDRTGISKDVLAGRREQAATCLAEEAFYAEHDVSLHLGTTATAIDPVAQTVATDDGTLDYSQLLLATGGEPIALDVPGAELDGVHYLHDAADVAAIRAAVAGGARSAVVVGAGFIGVEAAACLRQLGLEVTVLERALVPLDHALGPEVGAIVARVHDEEGVRLLAHRSVEAVRGTGRVETVRDTQGEEHAADLVVVGLGVRPATALAQAAGLAVADGIVVDERCQTSIPGVYAAGDVAAFPSRFAATPGRLLRLRHYANALEQGAFVAGTMLGDTAAYAHLPWFWSDQYDLSLRWVGAHRVWREVAWRGDPETRSFTALYLGGDGLVAACCAGRPRDFRAVRRLLAAGPAAIGLDELRDPDVDLYEVAKRSPR